MFQEELVEQLPDRGLGLVRDKLAIVPAVAVRSRSAERLAQLGADRDGRRDAFGDLLALPLGACGFVREEHAAGRGRRVDVAVDRDEIGLLVAEVVAELQEFSGVAGEPRQL